MTDDQLRLALEQRAAVACRMAHKRGESTVNPYLPGSDQYRGWEAAKFRIEQEAKTP